MKIKFLILFFVNLLFLINITSAYFYYEVSMNYSNGEIKVNSINTLFSHYELYYFENNSEAYIAKIGERNFYFNKPEMHYETGDENGEITGGGKLEEFEFEIILPYSGSGKKLEIYDNSGNKILERSLIEYTRLYNEKEYEKINPLGETPVNDTLDNKIDNIEDSKKTFDYSIILVIILVLVLIGLVIYYFYKEKAKKKK